MSNGFRIAKIIKTLGLWKWVMIVACLMFTQCEGTRIAATDRAIVSVKEQKMVLQRSGMVEKVYPISTSKFGIGDRPRSYCTPLGRLYVHDKVGDGMPMGMVFKSRRPTGEIVPPNSPGRDPIVTRILRLGGTESENRNCLNRNIYIHGTPEERRIGTPASYGCIRMRSYDVIDLYNRLQLGDRVNIIAGRLPDALPSGGSSNGM